ncbi:DEAD/DEAH box helicase, partial [Enterococcus faecium]
SLSARKKKSNGSSREAPRMTCSNCGQQILLKSLLKIENKPHCPFSLQEIVIKEKEISFTFD